ncbi:MAG: DNA polymerase III subunit gamma/tau, partial [Aestuariivirga sp.]
NGHTQAPQARIKSFTDVVALAKEKRDIKFQIDLEKFIRPISVADGKIELVLERGADPTLANELSRKLEAWTSRRWIIAVSTSAGEATMAQQRKDAKDSAFKWAKAQADVQAVLKAFPGAEILNVSEVEPISTPEEAEDEPR